MPFLLRWPAQLEGGRQINMMTHMADWLPTLLDMMKVPRLQGSLPLDGVNLWPYIREGRPLAYPVRCWQWNRYRPILECNAAIREDDWKLVRPAIPTALSITQSDWHWLQISMYDYEYFVEHGLIQEPFPEPELPALPPPELYHIAQDPLEQHNLAPQHPDLVSRLLRKLENWFEEVERERQRINI